MIAFALIVLFSQVNLSLSAGKVKELVARDKDMIF